MNVYQKISTVLALSMFLPLVWQILRGQVKQNIATWTLWGLLDAVAAASIFVQNGNWYLPAAYVIGALITVTSMVRARNIQWGPFESTISIMVLLCIFAWYQAGPQVATILSTTAVALATVPQWMDAYKRPWEMPLLIYIGYCVANVLATMGGNAWTIEERLYPATCVVLCVVIVLLSGRRFFIAGRSELQRA